MRSAVHHTFRTMGTEAQIWLRADRPQDELEELAAAVRASLEDTAGTLTRFRADSELSRLNADPREQVEASPLLRRLVAAARQAGERTGGLVDATLLGPLEDIGYATSRDGVEPAPLEELLRRAPARRGARPHPEQAWRRLEVAGTRVVRPPGVRIDSGGLGKGLAADVAAQLVPPGVTYAIGAGGDLAVGGARHQPVVVTGARTGERVHTLDVRAGGVATSGLHRRLWVGPDGEPAHHILDPATGRPAWTGLLAATAVAGSALEAEVLAKAAFLAGPVGARRVLRRGGGVLQHETGELEVLPGAPVVRLPRPAVAA